MDQYGAAVGLIPVLLVVVAFFGQRQYRRWRKQRTLDRPFPPRWAEVVQAAVPLYAGFSQQEQQSLQDHIKLFLADVEFYGCNGLAIDDEIRVTIAAQACLLVLNRPPPAYPRLQSILVYPNAFIVNHETSRDDGVVHRDAAQLLGESWDNGRIILSWDDVSHGVADFSDGHNVTLHEFAHQLDAESGNTNGAPLLRHNSYKSWSRVFTEHYRDLQHRAARNRPTVIDDYGAANPAEFFAVVTETFFENPQGLHHRRPELFAELVQYYRCDPRTWHESLTHKRPRAAPGSQLPG